LRAARPWIAVLALEIGAQDRVGIAGVAVHDVLLAVVDAGCHAHGPGAESVPDLSGESHRRDPLVRARELDQVAVSVRESFRRGREPEWIERHAAGAQRIDLPGRFR